MDLQHFEDLVESGGGAPVGDYGMWRSGLEIWLSWEGE
jgi:hypothetical protein